MGILDVLTLVIVVLLLMKIAFTFKKFIQPGAIQLLSFFFFFSSREVTAYRFECYV